MSYIIMFTDGTTETVTCDSYRIDSGTIYFLDSEGDALLIANVFSNIKCIKRN